MDLQTTLIGLAISLAAFAFSAFMERRPLRLGRVRHIPFLALMFIALVSALLFAVHLISLLGES